ncbi:lasso peptide biosynthesis PqqD family chaperone [Actinomadura rudentiformis]|uniref:Lasso peptide biosynthesis PqqD family chaperone n=1 Tax=Actinomadura rudentiformis TaxID=359158 RepID=A0A6H9YYC1_9ACTN|nr:lasso peptide biosynthesis PqqD family chaperone [Actinomadura rudentiformis]KAB2352444.1 lasso peptide biosynthesis PqqD family chaperone [Actinomadura rudentiformis]
MRLGLSPHVSMTETEHGMVLLDEKTGRYWQTNATGAAVVRLLAGGATVEEATEALAHRYPSAADRVAADVDTLVRSLKETGMVAS